MFCSAFFHAAWRSLCLSSAEAFSQPASFASKEDDVGWRFGPRQIGGMSQETCTQGQTENCDIQLGVRRREPLASVWTASTRVRAGVGLVAQITARERAPYDDEPASGSGCRGGAAWAVRGAAFDSPLEIVGQVGHNWVVLSSGGHEVPRSAGREARRKAAMRRKEKPLQWQE